MGKTRAEIQKQYRERKKKKDPKYLENERKRAASYRVPAALLSKKKLNKRRTKNKDYCVKYRQSKKGKGNNLDKHMVASNEIQSNDISSTSQPIPSTSKCSTRSAADKMLIKFDFGTKSVPGKRRSKALRTARVQIDKFSLKLQNQVRMTKRWQKRCERLRKQDKPENVTTEFSTEELDDNRSVATPRSKTNRDLRSAGISPRKLPKSVVKRLQMGNCLIQGLRYSRENIRLEHDKRQADKILCSSGIIKKYRYERTISQEINLNRKRFRKLDSDNRIARKRRNEQLYTGLKMDVQAYFERDDISRCMPGKNDAVKVGGEKKQVRILNDYLINLHEKFTMENRDKNISFSAFCKLRPKNIKTTSLLSRNTCLCTIHQNMALKLKCLKGLGVDININPEVVKKTVSIDDMKEKLNALDDSEKEFEQWKRVEIDGKKKMRIVKAAMSNNDFKDHILKEYKSFLDHTDRISAQYSAIYRLKETLKVGHVILQMDFAENFQCQTMDEIQSAYWNATSVTLHPVVAYFRLNEDDDLKHKNFVFVSDLNNHNSTAVITIIHMLIPILKTHIPNVDTVHYWTDSPSSQYRNRFIINLIANHKQIFGVNACWNFFETGHGKGPCDGIGGTCKRRAAEAVKQGKATIQDAHDFYKWAHTNEMGIAYHFYSLEEYSSTAENIDAKVKAIPGTMTLHAVVASGDGRVLVRQTSCYCDGCTEGTTRCAGWLRYNLIFTVNDKPRQNGTQRKQLQQNNTPGEQPRQNETTRKETPDESVEPTSTNIENQNEDSVEFDIGDYVCAVYQNKWYIGEITGVDNTENDAEISFLERKKQLWQWPSREDKVWINFHDIICTVIKPVPTGKSKRMLKLNAGDKEKIEKAFDGWKQNS